MKRSDRIAGAQLRIGIFMIIALAVLGTAIMLLGEKERLFTSKGRLSVIMTDVAGLKVGAPVWLAGIEVGVVKEVRFDQPEKNNDVEVLLEVERNSLKKIGRDSVITVRTRGLVGEKYVDITPSRSVALSPETRLHGTSTAGVDDVMVKAGAVFDHLDQTMERMNRGEGSLGRFTHDPKLYDNLARLTSELAQVMASINRGEGSAGKFIKNPAAHDQLMTVLKEAETTLKEIRSGNGTMGQLIQNRELYDQSLTTLQRAERSLTSLEELTGRLNRGEGSAGKLVTDQELYNRLNRTVEDLDLLIKDIRANPKKYLDVSVF
jgi:phospholipid/cholesterol/gamma-HCH transport system substrate-binding protein